MLTKEELEQALLTLHCYAIYDAYEHERKELDVDMSKLSANDVKNQINWSASAIKNAVGYIRCSTQGQMLEDKFGVDAQKMQILEYCAKNNYSITQWYVDGAVSGVKEERPELNKILFEETVTNPPTTTVIVAKSDRIARDINLYFYYRFLLT